MSTDVSQVLSQSSLLYIIFYHLTFPGFPFVLVLRNIKLYEIDILALVADVWHREHSIQKETKF